MGWHTIVLKNFNGGGSGIKDLRTTKTALMSKNVFSYLDDKNLIWVDILNAKFGNYRPWQINITSKCSHFFRTLWITSFNMIKPYVCIKDINPYDISFLNDPWFY